MCGRLEGRKVQRVGYSTLAVSLPGEWVKEVGLAKGDVVIMEKREDGRLELMPSAMVQRKKDRRETVVDADLCDERGVLTRVIVGNYVLGRDQIVVTSSHRISPLHLEEIGTATGILMGLSVIEETPNHVVMQCSIDPEKFPLDVAMRRMHSLSMTMYREAVEAFLKLDSDLAETVARREEQADKMYWLIVRLLLSAQQDPEMARKIGVGKMLRVVDDRLIAKFLEIICDYSEIIARRVISIAEKAGRIPRSWADALEELSGLAFTICDHAMECVFNGDIKVASSAIEAKNVVQAKEEALMNEMAVGASEESVPLLCADLRAVAWGFRRIAEYGAAIAEIGINRTLSEPSEISFEPK